MAGFDAARLQRMHAIMAGHVSRGDVPGVVTVLSRHGETHVDVLGTSERGGGTPLARDTIFRIASLTKPIVAAAAMTLVEECVLRLDDPVDELLPELADRRVLRRTDGPLDDTVPATRAITLRDLLTMRMGLGYVMEPGERPILRAANELQLLLGPPRPQRGPAPDEWMRRVGTLPLIHQPGERWMYDLSFDVLGVLVSRAAGMPLEAFLRARIFDPLGMKDTGFHVPGDELHRLPTSYHTDPATGRTGVYDAAVGSEWSRPPVFPSASGGLVSTADDFLSFARMLMDGGRVGSERILSRRAVELMTSDQVPEGAKRGAEMFLAEGGGWGYGISVVARRYDLWTTPGQYGWTGALGTAWANDPAEGLIAIVLSQRAMDTPEPPRFFRDFWTAAYQAID